MADTPPPANPLGTVAGSVGLLAIALVFSGWIYRWHYYAFFQVDPTHLGFSVESTSLAAFSLLFRSPLAVVRTLVALAFALAAILVTFQGIRACRAWLAPRLRSVRHQRRRWDLGPSITLSRWQRRELRRLGALLQELVIGLWLLLVLHQLASWQGVADARRDATTETSTLPLVTLAMKESSAVIGRDLDQPFANPAGVRVFGSRERYEALLGAELNPADQRTTWRLLADTGNQVLVIPTLPKAQTTSKAPPVLLFNTSDQSPPLVVLSPAPTP
jgi:hypothetical protein